MPCVSWWPVRAGRYEVVRSAWQWSDIEAYTMRWVDATQETLSRGIGLRSDLSSRPQVMCLQVCHSVPGFVLYGPARPLSISCPVTGGSSGRAITC